MSRRDERFEELFGCEPEETPETVANRVVEDFMGTIAEAMRSERLRKKDLAAAMGVDPSTLSGYFREDANLTVLTMARLAMGVGKELGPIGLVEDIDDAIATRDFWSGARGSTTSEPLTVVGSTTWPDGPTASLTGSTSLSHKGAA